MLVRRQCEEHGVADPGGEVISRLKQTRRNGKLDSARNAPHDLPQLLAAFLDPVGIVFEKIGLAARLFGLGRERGVFLDLSFAGSSIVVDEVEMKYVRVLDLLPGPLGPFREPLMHFSIHDVSKARQIAK